ncbi:tripartite motif-containing protein 3-like [Haliotis rufescens]|uniref:tripartite motif-containing protein 3-like n=1 Tax=Haliotis rufescens TaxID=6454 RepID=UPI00201FAB2B|nr:tripartite motif-containing protein 3-like [Haliotis rufescens]
MSTALDRNIDLSKYRLKDRVLTCTICLDLFNDPKILPCFHTFCKGCLWSHVLNTVKLQRFPCPLCRTEIRLPEGGVDHFQGNFYIQEFTDLIKQESEVKVKNTKNGGRSETDVTVFGEKKYPNAISYKDLYCPTHAYKKEWVVSYCARCRVPICLQCKMHEHSGHEWEDLAVVVGDAQRQLHTLDARVKRYRKVLGDLSEDRRSYMDNFCSQVSSVTNQIKTCAEDIKHKVDSRCESLLLLLDHLKVTETSRVESHELQVGTCISSLGEVTQGVEHMMKGSGVLDLLANKTYLKEKADDTVRSIPAFIEKISVVYDRKNPDGLAQKIECAFGYLSTEKDMSGGDDREAVLDPPTTPGLITGQPEENVQQPVLEQFNVTPSRPGLIQRAVFKVRPNNAGIRFIVPIPSLGIVIGYDSSPRHLDVVDEVGNKIQTYDAVPNTSCALLLGQTNLALCTSTPRQLSQRRLPQFSSISYRTSELPFTPTGLAVRDPRELIICGKEKAGIGTGIYRYSLETKQIRCVYANGDLHILKAPSSVVVTQDGDAEVFVVSDPKRKAVFFFDIAGNLLNTFPTQRCSFCPEGLCCDAEGNVLVADKGNNSVVLLSPMGVFIQELTRGVNPRALSFDGAGRLWMGESEGTITIFDYVM